MAEFLYVCLLFYLSFIIKNVSASWTYLDLICGNSYLSAQVTYQVPHYVVYINDNLTSTSEIKVKLDKGGTILLVSFSLTSVLGV